MANQTVRVALRDEIAGEMHHNNAIYQLKIIILIASLTLLSGCYCIADDDDTDNVVDYFVGCLHEVRGDDDAKEKSREKVDRMMGIKREESEKKYKLDQISIEPDVTVKNK